MTAGLEIAELGGPGEDEDRTITFHPINTRGAVSEACRVSIARSALPDVIRALQHMAGTYDEDECRWGLGSLFQAICEPR